MAAKTNGTTASDYKLKPLGAYAVDAGDAESFVKLVDAEYAKAGKTPNYSLSANGPADLYYDLVTTYIGDKARYDDGDASYAVLNAAWLYVGRSQESFDAYAADRREAMGVGAADRLAKARAAAAAASARKDTIIAALLAKLGMTEDDLEDDPDIPA
jgi:hypothetical protein